MGGLSSGLLVLGGMAVVASVFYIVVKDEFGERTAENLRKMHLTSAAKKWNKARGQRVSVLAARAWGIIGAVILVAAAVTWANGA